MLDLAIQLVDGIAAVHRRGLIHGNIKPSNVFVTDEGHVKVLELGLMSAWWETYGQPDGVDSSSPTASADQRLPPEAAVDGFHSYRSPEHLAGERRRSPQRHLLDWRGALRDGDRKQGLPWRHSVAHCRCDRVWYAAAS